ncbi:MAG TPA: phosphoenolpyruvate--protein phosphotransferase [Gemmatimonadales bacterium]|nr:phosphoenolpyruvate--protein phosphotransferase [Gemmatimonadales bacterium]
MSGSDRLLVGIGVSPGVVIGPAVLVQLAMPEVPHRVVARKAVSREVERLRGAVQAVRSYLERIRERAERRAGAEEAKIFDAQILMLEDEEFLGAVEGLIRDNQLAAERAYEFKALEMRALWSSNTRLRDRVADLSGVHVRLLQHLMGLPMDWTPEGLGRQPAIVFTRELTPGLTVQFDRPQVAGFVAEQGTRTSHAAILAHSLGIPCVMGLVGGLDRVRPGTTVILDGTRGSVLLDPTPKEIAEAQALDRRRVAMDRELERAVGQPAVTLDGVRLTLRGNVDLPEELDAAAQHGAEGVGLLRTEFMILGRSELPGEDEQVGYYARVGERFPAHPVIVRSYDLGGDKFPLPGAAEPEANPFLGWRGLRVCLDHPDIFRTQIRALVRARARANLQLMIPMVTQVEEVLRTREMIVQAIDELKREGREAAPDLPLGVMVETPAAVVMIDRIAEVSDFLSVGSNDLTQYTLVVDRGNARLADRFTPLHPAVVRLLKATADAGHHAGKEVSVCGEMASEPVPAVLLLGLGYRVLSTSPPRLPLVRWLVRQFDVGRARRAAEAALEARTTGEVLALLQEAVAEQVDLRLLDAGRLPRTRHETSLKR